MVEPIAVAIVVAIIVGFAMSANPAATMPRLSFTGGAIAIVFHDQRYMASVM